MNLFFKTIHRPLRIIVPLAEVKRRAIIDALDRCDGSYRLAAHLLGIGRTTLYRMAKTYNYQPPSVQGQVLMTLPLYGPRLTQDVQGMSAKVND
jgi:Bacterial regulatory protein, Fis family